MEGGGASTDHLLEVGAGHRFGSGLGIDFGYRFDRLSGERSNGFGLLIS